MFLILCAFDLKKLWAKEIMEALKREGYEIFLSRNCADEIFDIDLDQFDLLIIDPVMTGSRSDVGPGGLPMGIHVVKCLRAVGCNVPIMAFAEVNRAEMQKLHSVGVDTVVDLKAHPAAVDKYLLSAVERLIRSGRALRG